ncbi:MAG: galactose-1-phosphate uridylyltransferase [Gemmatimonadaceae bacterium]
MVWEERWHPLRREWVVISSHRNDRPWLGETVDKSRRQAPEYDASCYLCPGNARISGATNPLYTGVFTFDNDHPSVGPTAPLALDAAPGIYQNRPAQGLSRVVCFTPRHDLTLAQLSRDDLLALLGELQTQYRDLTARDGIRHVLVFENKGEVVGVSNPHPHCQIYATNFVFKSIEIEAEASREYFAGKGRPLFQDIIASEESDGRRLLVSRGGALSFVPYFARYPYETYVAPRGTHASVADLSDKELDDFADVLLETLVRLENLWKMPLPHVMVFHQAPVRGPVGEANGFHFRIEILPPLRKPGLLKYLAGPEIGGGCFLNDTAPEAKAAELRALSSVHYKRASA